jgi:hypothetical protein
VDQRQVELKLNPEWLPGAPAKPTPVGAREFCQRQFPARFPEANRCNWRRERFPNLPQIEKPRAQMKLSETSADELRKVV